MSKKEAKIIFTGPDGSGKTSAIKTVNQLPPMTSTDSRGLVTTSGMDYGELSLEDELVLRLYGTVGEDFPYLWRLMSRDTAGFVILNDNSRNLPLASLGQFLDHFNFRINNLSAVIGVTHMDEEDTPGIQEYEKYLESRNEKMPVSRVNATSREDVLMLLNTLFSQFEKK